MKLAEVAHTLDGAEVEVDAQVDAALAVVAIERSAVAELVQESRELAQVSAQMRGRNAGIVPALVAFRLAGNKGGCAESGLAHVPDAGGVGAVVDAGHRRFRPGLRRANQRLGFGLRFSRIPCAHLHQQEAAAGRKQGDVVHGELLALHEIDDQPVKAFQPDGIVFQNARHNIGGEKAVGEGQHGEHAEGRTGGEVERGGDDRGAGALGADQRAGYVEAVLVEQLVEVVAGDAAGNARESFADERGVMVAQLGEVRVDLAHAAAGADQGVELGWRWCGPRT